MTRDDAEDYTVALGQVFSGGWRLILHAQKQGIPQALGMTTQDWVRDRLGGYVRMGGGRPLRRWLRTDCRSGRSPELWGWPDLLLIGTSMAQMGHLTTRARAATRLFVLTMAQMGHLNQMTASSAMTPR